MLCVGPTNASRSDIISLKHVAVPVIIETYRVENMNISYVLCDEICAAIIPRVSQLRFLYCDIWHLPEHNTTLYFLCSAL